MNTKHARYLPVFLAVLAAVFLPAGAREPLQRAVPQGVEAAQGRTIPRGLSPNPTNPVPEWRIVGSAGQGSNVQPMFCNYIDPKSCFHGPAECSDANNGRPCFINFGDYAAIKVALPEKGSPQDEAAALQRVSLPIDYKPTQRQWEKPFKRCTSQDGTQSGYVSVGEGGRRCEYFVTVLRDPSQDSTK